MFGYSSLNIYDQVADIWDELVSVFHHINSSRLPFFAYAMKFHLISILLLVFASELRNFTLFSNTFIMVASLLKTCFLVGQSIDNIVQVGIRNSDVTTDNPHYGLGL